MVPITGWSAILLTGYFLRRKREGWAFVMTAITIAFALVTMFLILLPARDDLQPEPRLEPDHLQRLLHPLYPYES